MKTNINMKKVIASLVAAGVLMSGTGVFAADNAETADYNIIADAPMLYNGSTVIAPVVISDGHKTVPLRQIMEGLNFIVAWDDETQQIRCSRGAVEIGFTVGQDGYTFAKTAPMPLGVAPYLYNDETTYVPVELFTDVLGASVYDESDGYVSVVEPASVTFKSLESDDYGTYIMVNDSLRGEVMVRIAEDTLLNDGQGLDVDELVEGQPLKIGYDAAMTMSIPPQTTAISINTISAESDDADKDLSEPENVAYEGVITAIYAEQKQITIDDNGVERSLNIDENTEIKHIYLKRIYTFEDLTVGSKVSGLRDAIETKSLPPISNAVSVEIAELAE